MKPSRHLLHAILCAASLAASTAHAGGWYEVRNYTGTIGSLPIHLSLQTYAELNHDEPRRSQVDGSYYYDAHRLPIPLQGKRQADGSMQLCEAVAPASFGDSPKVPVASPAHPVPCPISLKPSDNGAAGEWRDGKHVLPITLHQVGTLDDTRSDKTPSVSGTVEIPMWHHTGKHLLLGIYESSSACPLSMARLRLVNLRSGQTDKELKLECGAGTVATSIYSNVYAANSPRHVTIIFEGGYHGMGDDREVPVEP